MQKGIIGRKMGMTQIFDEKGNVVPVTVIEAGPCVVTQKKTVENDGYAALQLGFGDVSAKHVNKPMKGHFDKSDVAPKKTLREFRLAALAMCSRRTSLPPATAWTWSVPARARATPARSSAGTSSV